MRLCVTDIQGVHGGTGQEFQTGRSVLLAEHEENTGLVAPCLSLVSIYTQAELMENNYQDKMEMLFTYSV